MILYDYWRSSSAWRVRIALHLKAIPFERRVVDLGPAGGAQHRPEFKALNPMSQVPVLIDDGGGAPRALTQSHAIIAYLDERFPAPPLYPADPWLRARARQLVEIVNSGIQPFQNLAHLQRLREAGVAEPAAIARGYIERGLGALEALAVETAGRFLIGDAPTVADAYLIPQLYSARRYGADLAPTPTLLRVEAACAALPAFRAAHADAQTDAQQP